MPWPFPNRPRTTPPEPELLEATREVDAGELRRLVEAIAVPRNYFAERSANRQVGEYLRDELAACGLEAGFQGRWENVVATTESCRSRKCLLVGAHYDSAPGCPGADDNASAVAAMVAVARVVGRRFAQLPICFVAFNGEEDQLLGSRDFVGARRQQRLRVRQAHVLEMVGYRDRRPGSQRTRMPLPVRIPPTGDFLGLVSNWRSSGALSRVLRLAGSYSPELRVLGLKVYLGLERLFPVLQRSDHKSFWRAGIPALMWTDTAEFRNRHYHRASDTPETLDYEFLEQVARLLLATAVTQARR